MAKIGKVTESSTSNSSEILCGEHPYVLKGYKLNILKCNCANKVSNGHMNGQMDECASF